jgi:alcohol dehydrogenase (cytochrome c)
MRKTMLFANRSGVYYVLDRETGEFLLGRSFVRTNWVDGFDADGRPRQVIFPTPEGTQVFPGNQGGTNWYPPSYSPATGLVYIPTWENTASIYRTAEEPTEFHEGQTFAGPSPGRSATGEEYSAVRALDPATGEKVWDYVQTAPSTEAGILTTASNVLFSGSRDGHFYALDARDGTVLWDIGNLGASVSAGPMSYAVNGEQYVAIQVGRALYAFGLPE